MGAEPYTCALDEATGMIVKLCLFKNTKNVDNIRTNVINGTWQCAVIKPSLIVDPFQVAVAANKAVVSQKLDTMVTRSVFTELLYNLSLTKNITQSLSKFGIEKDDNLLVCFLEKTDSDMSHKILSLIEGELLPITELKHFTNMKQVKSIYKLNKDISDENILDVVVSRMVTKHFVSH